jgi:rhodanese-related sulfurtransferase
MDRESMEPALDRRARWPLWLWGVFLVLGLAAILLLRVPTHENHLAREIPVAQAVVLRDQGSFLLDVRQPDEWEEAHIPGATLIPLGELEARVAEVPRDRDIVVVCRSGNRSKRGRDILLGAGFAQVTSMSGGMIAWKERGQPTVSGP